jgi:ADP-dependent NAD(P)H-hydrate dehydratase / NAD(P)H-hydrate epimerase
LGACVRAEHTVTFGFLKTGLLTTSGYATAGRVTLSHLGVPAVLPAEVVPMAFLLEEGDVRSSLAPRDPSVHKVQAGRVVIVGGSAGMTGAPNLSGRAALRAGAGLVTVILPQGVSWGGTGELPALMTKHSATPLSDEALALVSSADAVALGPGLGRSLEARERVLAVLALGRPTVLDADGLRAVEGNLGALHGHPALVLTPHAGEAAGLLGITAAEVEQDRFSAVRRLAVETGATILLKGPRTLIAEPSGRVLISAFGTPALATAGSGDVLAGIVAGLAAGDRMTPDSQRLLDATWLGAALHGLAAEHWSETGGDAGLLATDLIDGLPAVRARLLRGH